VNRTSRRAAGARSARPARRAARTGNAGGALEREARAVLREAAASMARLATRAPRGYPSAAQAVAEAAEFAIASLESGGTVYFCGNGGSAADAQHLAAELAGRYLVERPALAAVALSTNTSAVTAIGNDYGFDQVFSRQLEALGTAGDVLVAISTSGRSPNVVAAIETAHRLGMSVIGMTGAPGRAFAALCDVALVTPDAATPRIQEGHIAMGHVLCGLIEGSLFGRPAPVARRGRRKAGRP
jgi:D-sedoheptulose 7-phosphate isomerase